MPWPIWSLEAVLRCQVRICDWSIEVCHYRGWESVSDSTSVHWYGQCTHNINNFLPHAPLQLYSFWGYGEMFHMYYYLWQCITEQQSSFRSTERSYPLQSEIILQVVTQRTGAPGHRYMERGYVCVYISCGHYSRLGDIKCLSDCIIMYGVHSIWFSLFHRHPPPEWSRLKHSFASTILTANMPETH